MKTITICSSASFYKDVLDIEQRLKTLGYEVKIPSTAKRMEKNNDFTVERYKTWFEKADDYAIKKQLMDEHFEKVISSDAILVVNQEKKGVRGYIGGNALMEMAMAYHYHKPIYLWNNIDENHPFGEEIKGMQSIPIDQDFSKIVL